MPTPPQRPEPDECCNGGCERCIFDVYADAMDRYEAELAAWKARHPGLSTGERGAV
ncbi:MAG TPA: oxidoreductase-like domain-containing protein [Casimicrobiaceae bacterium]